MRVWIRETCLDLIDKSRVTVGVFLPVAALAFASGHPQIGYALVWVGSGLVLGPLVVLVVFFWKDGPGHQESA